VTADQDSVREAKVPAVPITRCRTVLTACCVISPGNVAVATTREHRSASKEMDPH